MADDPKKGKSGFPEGFSKFLRPGARKDEPKPEPKKADKTERVFSVWLEPGVIRQLKFISVESGKTQKALMNEAMNLLFKAYDKPEIA